MATVDHPNVLLVMSDEHAPQYSSTYGHPIVVRSSPPTAWKNAPQLCDDCSAPLQRATVTAVGLLELR
eukprot:COSAG02_NODE_1576_length_11868_cov_82.967117_3_plen_68_part_00